MFEYFKSLGPAPAFESFKSFERGPAFFHPPPPSGADSFLVSDCAQEDPEVAKAFGMRLLRIEAWGHSNAFRVCDQ